MKTYKGIIFDLDGVICHTDEYHYMAWQSIADEMGIPFDRTVNHRLRGVSRMESLAIILENTKRDFAEDEKLAMADKKNERYRKYLEDMKPGDVPEAVKKTLVSLKEKGIRLAIGSSSKNGGFILEKIGLQDFFDAVIDGNDISFSKPHPEVFLKAAASLGVPPQECLVVEDALAGVEAAVSSGMDVAALGDAKKSEKATYRLLGLEELMEM